MAAPSRLAAARSARARPRDTGRRRTDRQEAARGARAADDPGRARVPAAALRACGSGAGDLGSLRRGGGGDRRRGAERPRPARPPAPAREGASRRRVRRDHRRLVQPGMAQGPAPARHRVRLRGNLKGSEFTVRSYDVNGVAATADFAPVYPASEEITVKKLRDVVGKALDYAGDVVDPLPAALRAREGSPAAPTRSSRFTVPERGAGRAGSEATCLRRADCAPGRAREAQGGTGRGAGAGAR